MKITQIRNATIVIESGDHAILVDPMLAPKEAIPSLKYFTGGRRRNPLVDLPASSDDILSRVTACLITHCQKGHFDHLDRRGVKWLRDNDILIYCSKHDVPYLLAKGLRVQELDPDQENPFLEGTIKLIPCLHGKGVVGKMMEHGYGFHITLPGEPTLYLSGDTILTDSVRQHLKEYEPHVSVIPAGGARFDIGGEIIMGLEEAIQVGEISSGKIVANHLESLDHCPVTRKDLFQEVTNRQWESRFFVPKDGEQLSFSA